MLYTEEHEWVRVLDEQVAVVGITDHAQEQLGEIVYLDLPKVGERVTAGDEFGSIESVKASSELYTPVSGEVIEVNTSLKGNPELVNQSPFEDGWMVRIRMDDPSEVHGLMDAEAYAYHTRRANEGGEEDVVDSVEAEEREDA